MNARAAQFAHTLGTGLGWDPFERACALGPNKRTQQTNSAATEEEAIASIALVCLSLEQTLFGADRELAKERAKSE